MLEIFEDITVWTVIIAILIIWLAITLLMCLQCVKEECEDGYNAFAGSFIILGGLSSWAAAYFDLPYYLAWGCAGGVIFTLLFVRTSTMREFRNTFLAYFSCTFWGCWIPKHNRSNRRLCNNTSIPDDEGIDYGLSPYQQELINHFSEGMDRWGVRGDPIQARSENGIPLDSDGNTDWNAVEQETEHYNDLDILSRD